MERRSMHEAGFEAARSISVDGQRLVVAQYRRPLGYGVSPTENKNEAGNIRVGFTQAIFIAS